MKQRTSPSTAKAMSSTQRPQTCTEAAAKYSNYIVNEADEERDHRLPTLPKATRLDQATRKVYSQNYLLRRSDRQQELCTSRISFQRTRNSRSAFTPWATMGLTVSFILQWTPIMYDTMYDNVWSVTFWTQNPCWTTFSFTIFITFNASVNSACAQPPPPPPPPPGWPPGICIFWALDGKFPGVGTFELSNLPGWGRKKRTNAPFSINHCVKWVVSWSRY